MERRKWVKKRKNENWPFNILVASGPTLMRKRGRKWWLTDVILLFNLSCISIWILSVVVVIRMHTAWFLISWTVASWKFFFFFLLNLTTWMISRSCFYIYVKSTESGCQLISWWLKKSWHMKISCLMWKLGQSIRHWVFLSLSRHHGNIK